MKIIEKQKLMADPGQFGLDLGKNPTARITAYERYALFPQAVTLKVDRGRIGYYAPIHVELLKEILRLTRVMKYPGIERFVKQNFHSLFMLHDVLGIFRLRFLDRDFLEIFLERSGLTDFQQGKILDMYDEKVTYKEVKIEILNMMCKLKYKPKTKTEILF